MRESDVKTDPRIVRSKAALREALLFLMARQPFAAVSITDIIKQASYNRSTFYTHYASKEALLEDMITETISGLLDSFRAPYAKTAMFYPHELPAHSVMIFDHIAEHSSFYTILNQSDVLPLLRQKMFVSLKTILLEELIYEEADVDLELLVVYSLHALLGLIFHWIEGGLVQSPSYMQEQLVKILKHHSVDSRNGIRPRH